MKRLLVALFFLCAVACAQTPQYDVVIRNGRVVDGSGNPWVRADVAIIGDRIVFVGQLAPDVTAKRTIDASGLIVAPGFIDMLGQSEMALLVDKRAVSKLTQGITTEVTGELFSVSPQTDFTLRRNKDYADHFHITIDWNNLDGYFKRLEKQGAGVNLGTYVALGEVREAVMGDANRAPTADELNDEKEFVQDAMMDGALGLGTAIQYTPDQYVKTDELIELAKVVSKFGGIYASHIRSESDGEAEAIQEAITIGREAHLPVEIFHLKCAGRGNWGKMGFVIGTLQKARDEGIDITADQYPYTAAALPIDAVIPAPFHEGSPEQFLKRLQDPAVRAQIHKMIESGSSSQWENEWANAGGPDNILVASVLNPALKQFQGKTIAQVGAMQKKDPLDALIDLVIADRSSSGGIFFIMSEDDVKLALAQPFVAVGTDHEGVAPDGPLSEFRAHPRGYGSFPRILGRYVRDQHVLRLEDAIRKMTSLGAQRVHLVQRGLLRPDYFADITIFDPQKVNDVSTFDDPNRVSQGIEYVFVNGVLSVEHEQLTGQLGGRPLRGPGWTGRAYWGEGKPPRGKLQGVVTDEDGWPVGRTELTLTDASGKTVGSARTKYDGRFEVPLDQPCSGCTLHAVRVGFDSQSRTVDYNGVNPLWFSFALKHQPMPKE